MNIIKITAAVVWASSAPLVAGTGLGQSIDPFGPSRSELAVIHQPQPPCDTRTCSGNGNAVAYYYPLTDTYCQSFHQGIDYYQWAMNEYQWTCPGGLSYWTCDSGAASNYNLCSVYSAQPSCPSGNCIPYNGGHPG